MQQHSESSKLSNSEAHFLPWAVLAASIYTSKLHQCTIDFILFCLILIPYNRLCLLCSILAASLGFQEIRASSDMVDQNIIFSLQNIFMVSCVTTSLMALCNSNDSNACRTISTKREHQCYEKQEELKGNFIKSDSQCLLNSIHGKC